MIQSSLESLWILHYVQDDEQGRNLSEHLLKTIKGEAGMTAENEELYE